MDRRDQIQNKAKKGRQKVEKGGIYYYLIDSTHFAVPPISHKTSLIPVCISNRTTYPRSCRPWSSLSSPARLERLVPGYKNPTGVPEQTLLFLIHIMTRNGRAQTGNGKAEKLIKRELHRRNTREERGIFSHRWHAS